MTSPGGIIVGVDGSEASNLALSWAMDQAEAEHRSITLVHVVHPMTPVWLDPTGDDPPAAHLLALEAKGAEVLKQVREQVRQLDPGLTMHDLVRIGDAREVLLKLSETAALLVLGSRGRGPLRSVLLGSTSVDVVRRALCPVIVHRPSSELTARHGIAVGVDASKGSLDVLDFAFRQASLRAEPLTIVHARHFPTSGPSDDPFVQPSWSPDQDWVGMTDGIEKLTKRYPDVQADTIVAHARPERLLIQLADSACLLVVGVHPRSRTAEFTFGSMAVWLVEHADSPVAVLPLPVEG